MNSESHKELVRRFYEGPVVTGDVSSVGEYFHAEFVDHDPPRPDMPAGVDGARAVIEFLNRAFSDRSLRIHHLFGEDDMVGLRFSLAGTHAGPFMGRPPSGRRVGLEGMVMLRILDGKIVERWGHVAADGLEAAP